MLEIASDKDRDWHEAWKGSPNAQNVQHEIDRFHQDHASASIANDEPSAHSEFALPLAPQLYEVAFRAFQQYWRMPSYILAKFALSAASGLFIGFSFYNADNSEQGMQNVLYSLFQVCSIFSTIVQQIMPLFVTQRSLYEVRERPSKVYSWKVFLGANIIVEWPYQIIAGVLVFATFYYPVVGIQDSERQGLAVVLCIAFFMYASTFAQLCIAALPDAQTAGSIVTLLFIMTLIFNGIMQPPSALPSFWIFMYRVSPLTYWVGGMANAMLHGRPVSCSRTETSIFDPPFNGQTCSTYLAPYLTQAPGTLQNPTAISNCRYCGIKNADQFLAGVNILWSDRWRDFGLMWVYIAFNVAGTALLYWVFRVTKSSTTKSVRLSRKLDAIRESIRNSYKSEATVNKRNAKVF
jgi:ABC-type multidrug transport system permease subunit